MADSTDILLIGAGAALVGIALLRGKSAHAAGGKAAPVTSLTIPEWVKKLVDTGPATPVRTDAKGNVIAGKASLSPGDVRAETREAISRNPSWKTDLGKITDYLRVWHGRARADGLAYNYYWPPVIFELRTAGVSQVIVNTASSIAKGLTPK